ncbi:hypothetical protein CDAR_421531 [Caerostris darwini]|uniref:Uncharacterized protein n=1 Tax=Caerostris darwini TaxID=1538125 RepID=A0AAV4SWI1_9ARAC|nr:hypothetical protein CDAR_421531 [Caerostris darwini]
MEANEYFLIRGITSLNGPVMTADNASFLNGISSTRIRMGSSVTYSQTMNETRLFTTREVSHAAALGPKEGRLFLLLHISACDIVQHSRPQSSETKRNLLEKVFLDYFGFSF